MARQLTPEERIEQTQTLIAELRDLLSEARPILAELKDADTRLREVLLKPTEQVVAEYEAAALRIGEQYTREYGEYIESLRIHIGDAMEKADEIVERLVRRATDEEAKHLCDDILAAFDKKMEELIDRKLRAAFPDGAALIAPDVYHSLTNTLRDLRIPPKVHVKDQPHD